MMKFKVGDRVRVKPFEVLKPILDKNSTIDEDGDWAFAYEYPKGKLHKLCFLEEMLCSCSETAKISFLEEEWGRYGLEFDNKVFDDEDGYTFVEDWIEPYSDKPIYVSSFDDEEESKSEKLKAILAQIEQLAAEARKIVED